eukprot:COSAG01_NODE_22698_length_845_cov_0.962466_2_plen_60_part_01
MGSLAQSGITLIAIASPQLLMASDETHGSEKMVDSSPPSIQTNLLTFIAKQSYREMWEER